MLTALAGEEDLLIVDGGRGQLNAALEAAKDAGVTKIDHLIFTHWHGDHFGGLAELAKQIPIARFYDHGPNVQATPATDEFFKTVYEPLTAKATHTAVVTSNTLRRRRTIARKTMERSHRPTSRATITRYSRCFEGRPNTGWSST